MASLMTALASSPYRNPVPDSSTPSTSVARSSAAMRSASSQPAEWASRKVPCAARAFVGEDLVDGAAARSAPPPAGHRPCRRGSSAEAP